MAEAKLMPPPTPEQLERAARYRADPTLLIAERFILPTDRPFGEVMEPFQRDFFHAVFARHPDGRPVHRLVYDERRRGESKTEDSAAAAIADLLTGPRRHTSYAVAADEDQAGLIVDSILGFKARSPVLNDLIVQRGTVVNKISGARLIVLSADAPTSYGIRPRKVWFDELSLQPDDRLWVSMFSAIGKSPLAQMVALSMSGWDFSSIGWKVHELAASNPRYYFHTREGSELAPWLSKDDVKEQRATLHPSDFARFWECRWTEPKGSWITSEMYAAAAVGQESQTGDRAFRYVGFVDVGLVHDPTAISVCHGEEDRVVLDSMDTMQGSRSQPVDLEALEDLVATRTERFHVRHWIFEAPQAVASVQRLAKRLPGVKVEARFPTANTQAELFGTLYQLFSDHRLILFEHEQLRKEALALVIKTVSGRLKVVESTAVHQDHVIALGGAAGLVVSPKKERADIDLSGNRQFVGGGFGNRIGSASAGYDPRVHGQIEAENDETMRRAMERMERNLRDF